jgi:hypothetical protein
MTTEFDVWQGRKARDLVVNAVVLIGRARTSLPDADPMGPVLDKALGELAEAMKHLPRPVEPQEPGVEVLEWGEDGRATVIRGSFDL